MSETGGNQDGDLVVDTAGQGSESAVHPGQQPEVSSPAPVDDPAKPQAALEAAEKEPSLSLTVERACNNQAGSFVGLNKAQRGALEVDLGQSVELFDYSTGRSLGLFQVGLGDKTLTNQPTKFTVNGVAPGTNVEVKKPKNLDSKLLELDMNLNVETDPRHARRRETILSRFGVVDGVAVEGFDPDLYLVVPSAVAQQFMQVDKSIALSRPTILPISLGKVKIAGIEKTIAIVPGGQEMGFTSSAARVFGIPAETGDLRKAQYYIQGDTLVVSNFG